MKSIEPIKGAEEEVIEVLLKMMSEFIKMSIPVRPSKDALFIKKAAKDIIAKLKG